MSYLVDTNVLIHLVHQIDPLHSHAQRAYAFLRKQGETLCIVPQNLIEFWAVATRPTDVNGLGLTLNEAEQEFSLLKRLFLLKQDTPTIFAEWEKLILEYEITGKQVHDTRLVAAMLAYNLTHILTFNIKDFKRFSQITPVDPRSLPPNLKL